MNILYLSCHSILEENELSILHELGHEVFSLGGAYQNPANPGDPKRPPIVDMPFNQQLSDIAMQCSKDKIHDELLKWADVIICMHRLDWLENNWGKIREFGVVPIWRTIGQSTTDWEKRAAHLVPEGLKIVRYSPRERFIPRYAGEAAMVRFGADPNLYQGWRGGANKVHVFGQHIKGRGSYLKYPLIEQVTDQLPRVMHGPDNDDVYWSGGPLSFEALRQTYQTADVAFYTGTVPASYTLSFIEMLMTGTPLVCIGENLAFDPGLNQRTYEVHEIIKNNVNGFISDDPEELRGFIKELLQNGSLRHKISKGARQTALELFDRKKTMNDWKEFLLTCPRKTA